MHHPCIIIPWCPHQLQNLHILAIITCGVKDVSANQNDSFRVNSQQGSGYASLLFLQTIMIMLMMLFLMMIIRKELNLKYCTVLCFDTDSVLTIQ